MDYLSGQTQSPTLDFSPTPCDVRMRAVPMPALESPCLACKQHASCLPAEFADAAQNVSGKVLIGRRRLRKGQDAFRQGDRVEYLHVVRAGSFKLRFGLRDGREHVSAFALAGDLLEPGAIGTGRHVCSATALEDADVCFVAFESLMDARGDSAALLREQLPAQLARELVRSQRLLMLIAHTSADVRVAAFLLHWSQRLAERGYSPDEFQLRMSRNDIGSHLGLSLETVSRTMSALDARGWIVVEKRRLRVRRRRELAQLCDDALPGGDPLFTREIAVAPRAEPRRERAQSLLEA
jgi:CRP/FNR family transcriptional regulator, anaerobic regulatory protein